MAKLGNGDELKTTLQPGADCLPAARLGEPLSPSEHTHVARCPRCRSELALYQEFQQSVPGADEGAAVQWVVAELGRRRSPDGQVPAARRFSRITLLRRALLPLAAAAVLTVAVVVLNKDPEPAIGKAGVTDVYRTATIVGLSPQGNVKTAPTTLVWTPFDGVLQYDVALHEVDGTLLWRGVAQESRIALPAPVLAQLVPGKTVRWKVSGRDAGGAVIAESSTELIRVAP